MLKGQLIFEQEVVDKLIELFDFFSCLNSVHTSYFKLPLFCLFAITPYLMKH